MPDAKRTFMPEDLYRLIQVSDPQIHPDEDLVAFVRSHVEGEHKELRSHIWIAPFGSDEHAEGSTLARPDSTWARPYTRGSRQDGQPRWSPDGRRLAFVRQTGDGLDADRQIWIIDREGGEAWPLTSMRHGAGQPVWSPDSSRLAFEAALGDEETDQDACTPKTESDRKREKQKGLDEARLVTRFQYKFDHTGMFPPHRSHVWVVEVPTYPPVPASAEGEEAPPARAEAAAAAEEEAAAATEEGSVLGARAASTTTSVPTPRRVTQASFDHDLLDWSPDGRFVAVGASYEDEREPIQDIWIFKVDDNNAAPVKLTAGDGVFYDARWSPDGQQLAVIGHLREHRSATFSRLWLFPAPGQAGDRTCLTSAWDRGLGGTVNSDVRPGMAGAGLTWAPDGDSVYFVADDRGQTRLYRLPVGLPGPVDSPAEPEVIAGGPAEIYGFSLNRTGDSAVIAQADIFNPGDIYELNASPTTDWTRTRLTAVNADLLDRIQLPTVEEITFVAADDLPMHGWIMRPVTTESNGGSVPAAAPWRHKAPAVLQIHGGPHTTWGHSFSLEMHLQAALGYAVIFVNPRGSTSYGQQFASGCLDDYGGRDYGDLMAAVDHAIGLGGIDKRRIAVTGGSYGGFMTNWIVTQTNRFRAGIAHRSISNWVSFWGVSDIGPRFMDGEFGAPSLWNGFDDMWERSPLKHARNVETPVLICHSEHDLRCPMEQAEQFYLALKWEGKTAELLRHPRSNHDLTRTGPPTLRVDRLRHMARFLQEHVGNA